MQRQFEEVGIPLLSDTAVPERRVGAEATP